MYIHVRDCTCSSLQGAGLRDNGRERTTEQQVSFEASLRSDMLMSMTTRYMYTYNVQYSTSACVNYVHVQVYRALLRKNEKGKKENYNNLNGLEKYGLYSLYGLEKYSLYSLYGLEK